MNIIKPLIIRHTYEYIRHGENRGEVIFVNFSKSKEVAIVRKVGDEETFTVRIHELRSTSSIVR